ncbi:MAG: ABC transporter permease [Asgard group archaeon]|nr:ABC transporter permease [Asgard group archaeon]
MKTQRILTIVKLEMTRQVINPMILVFTTLLVPLLMLVFGFALGENTADKWGGAPGTTIFDHMVPGFLAYAALLTIYDVAAGVAGERETGIQKRINTTPLTTAEYILSQMISYSVKPIIQLALGLGVAVAVGFRPAIFFGTAYSLGMKFVWILIMILFMVIFSFSSVGLGLITATFAKTANAAGGLAFAFIVPQQIFGSFIPPYILDMNWMGWIMPSWYAARGMQLTFTGDPYGVGIAQFPSEIWVRLGVLIAFSIVIYALGIILYERKKRR